MITIVILALLTTAHGLSIAGKHEKRELSTELNQSSQQRITTVNKAAQRKFTIMDETTHKIAYNVSGDYVFDIRHYDSKPGNPTQPIWFDNRSMPVLAKSSIEPWRLELGERLIKAANTHDAMDKCGSFVSLADYTWCRKAMPFEANPNFKTDYGSVHEYTMGRNENLTNLPKAEGFTALSFGIQGADPWSELLSGLYFLKTDLFDCFYAGKKFGPHANDQHKGYSRENPCTTRKCYTEEYQYHTVCLDDSSNVRGIHTDVDGKEFSSLFEWLKGRKPLSTFLKMDIEGSEWFALERLLDNEEELAKIRTLDMEVHFNYEPGVSEEDRDKTTNVTFTRSIPNRKSLTHNVEIMERLTEKFAVTGSTITNDLRQQVLDNTVQRRKNPNFVALPSNVGTKNGIRLDQYCISYVNRKLL